MKGIAGKIASTGLFIGLLFGVFVLGFLPFEVIPKLSAESWPSRKGVVTASYANRFRGGSARTGPVYRPEICGSYLDNGERFCISRVRYGGFTWGDGERQAHEVVGRYPKGKEIDVFHDPADRGRKILEARSPWTEMLVLAAIGLGFLAIPVFLWLSGRRKA